MGCETREAVNFAEVRRIRHDTHSSTVLMVTSRTSRGFRPLIGMIRDAQMLGARPPLATHREGGDGGGARVGVEVHGQTRPLESNA